MRNYSFGVHNGFNELPVEVLNLFADLVDNPNRHTEFSYEIVTAGLAGKIALDKPFNLTAYENAIRKNNGLCQNSRRKRVCSIDNAVSDEDDVLVSYDAISEDAASANMTAKVKDAFEELIDSEELLYAIETIKNLNTELMVVEEIDLVRCLKEAVRGVDRAVKTLKRISEAYPLLAENIQVVLQSGKEVDVLFA